MNIHLLEIPGVPGLKNFSWSPFASEPILCAKAWKHLADEVFYYGHELVEIDATKVNIFNDEYLRTRYNWDSTTTDFIDWRYDSPHQEEHKNMIFPELQKRLNYGDMVVFFASRSNLLTYNNLSEEDHILLEPIIGSRNTLVEYWKVYPTQSKLSQCLGLIDDAWDSWNFGSRIIPMMFDPSDYKYEESKEDYLLYIGRLYPQKGVHIAVSIAEELGKELIIAGPGEIGDIYPDGLPDDIHAIGVVGRDERSELMSKAAAILAPSMCMESHCKVVTEANFHGTPAITTDHSSFREIVIKQGVNGYRCRFKDEFLEYTKKLIENPNPKQCLQYATETFSYESLKPQWEEYFNYIHDVRDGKYIWR